ncbi:hypothetical protein E2562_034961 [Oryza meyeriana var. granulata]|uniref:Uncharacterized protein n=1 Tax=Oryza meyeriana var. granulata TaxID=110450 RepID=A0A6G1BRF4_9ORYZ|nr:hypothetical protein E2562_034961 [Oryza meyeriana var. granulata]
MVHTIGDHEAGEAKAPAGVRPTQEEAEGGTHAVAMDPAHPERASDMPPSAVAAIVIVPDWRTPIIGILTGRVEATTGIEEWRLR